MKVQLQLRDEYMDAKLKRRYQNLEEALKLRDEEWKNGWEIREHAFLFDQLRRDSELIKIMKEGEEAME